MVNLQRIGAIEGAQGHNHRLNWSQDGERLIVETRNGAVLWHMPTNTQTTFYDQVDLDGYNFRELSWDLARGQILAVTVGHLNAVTVFDMVSGQQLAVFDVADRAAPVSYWISEDNSTLVIYTPEYARLHDGRSAGLAVWNRDTLESIQLTPREDLAVYNDSDLRLSPDHRYFMVLGEYDAVDVWDLQALNTDGSPNARYHLVNIRRLHFVDAITLETYRITATAYQVARRLYTRITYRYDVRTGELLSETSEELSYGWGTLVYPG